MIEERETQQASIVIQQRAYAGYTHTHIRNGTIKSMYVLRQPYTHAQPAQATEYVRSR